MLESDSTLVSAARVCAKHFSSFRMVKKRFKSPKKFPPYLRRILYSYLKDRRIEYETKEGKEITVEITDVERGVPQGSLLGPLLWILVYNRVLKDTMEDDCKVLGYVDDTIVLAEADSYEEAKIKASMQTERVIQEIRSLGLKMATEKTEAIVFKGRKGKRQPVEDIIKIDRESIKVEKKLKYLGVTLDSRLSFVEHLRYVEKKIVKVKRALGRLMPNLRGPSEGKRRLYWNVIQSVVMYGVPVCGGQFYKK